MKITEIRDRSFSFLLIGILSILAILISCNDDEDVSIETVNINFPTDSVSFDENAGEEKTAIVLSAASNGFGSFDIQLSGATYGTDYTTIPDGSSGLVTMAVEEGTLFRSFSIIPADNEELDGDKFITLTLTNPVDAVELGNLSSIVVTIDDDERPAPINFELDDQMIAEDAGETQVQIDLDFAAEGNGTVEVEIAGSTYGTDYTTDPDGSGSSFLINVAKGETIASFNFIPTDNEVVDGNEKEVTFTLKNATGGLVLGDDITHEITIADDESPTLINFRETAQSIVENSGATTVDIDFAFAAEANGSFNVALSGAIYGTDYSTTPDGSSGTFRIDVTKGDTGASFSFMPIDNQIIEADKVVTLTLSGATGGIALGSKDILVITMTDDEIPTPITFGITRQEIREDGGAKELVVDFEFPALADGNFEVLVNSNGAYTTDYTTLPEESGGILTIAVERGDTEASLSYIPTDNSTVNSIELVTTFTLQNPSAAFLLGAELTQVVSIIDEEIPVEIDFVEETSSVLENGDAVTINLEIDSETLIPGTVNVALSGATYTSDYTTNPDGSSGTFTISVPAGSSSASFTVTPINNDIAADNRVVTFTLEDATGSLVVGNSISSYELTITDKDRAITNISAVRAMLTGIDPVTLAAGTVIKGIVISDPGANADQSLVIEDATAGIVTNFTSAHSFSRGDEIEIDLAGATISSVNALVQLTGELPVTNALLTSSDQLPAPQVITVTEAASGNFESQYVSVENVFFLEADGVKTLNESNTLSDGTNQLSSFVIATSFNSDLLPFGTGTISGIMGVVDSDVKILPQTTAEIFANNPTVAVNTDASSTAQSFIVEGMNLLGDITVDAPSNFEVSLSETTGYANDLTIDQSMTGMITVFARFTPTSSVEGVKSGEIMISTLQASASTLSVSGMESAAGPANLLLVENFDYGTTEGAFVNNGTGIGTDNWTAHRNEGDNPHNYVNTSLSLTGYPSSGVGGSVVTSIGEDVDIDFPDVTSGKVYASALVNVSATASTRSNGEYFMHFKVRDETTTFYSRVLIKDDGAGNLLFGIRENSGDRTFAATNFQYNTIYMVVLVYDFASGAAQLHVLDNVPATEPTPIAESGNDPNGDATILNEFAIRGDSDNPDVTIDGLRIGLDWDSIIGN